MQELPWDEQMKVSEAREMGAYLEERRKLEGGKGMGYDNGKQGNFLKLFDCAIQI